jgi:hypothetical protein
MTIGRAIAVADVSRSVPRALGNGAHGSIKLFVSPLGQGVMQLGEVPRDRFPTHTPFTTNMVQAAQLGACLGDAAFKLIRFDFLGDLFDIERILDTCTFELQISAKVAAAGA